MSVHGYPADMSIFCNLQLGFNTEVTRRHAPIRHRSRQCISCWRGAVGSAVCRASDFPFQKKQFSVSKKGKFRFDSVSLLATLNSMKSQ